MKLKITIFGKVHDVGYRLFLLNQADSLLINRFDARNVIIDGRQALIVLIEGDEEKIGEFVEFVKSEKPEKAVVEEVKVEEYGGAIRTIDGYRNSLMLEQLSKIVQVGLNMLEKQDKMLEKQDETIRKIDGVARKIDESKEYLGSRIDRVAEKVDEVARKIDESKKHVGSKIDDLRLDLRSYLDERLRKIEKEIEAIKARIGMD